MNPRQFFKSSRLVPTMLCAASFLAGLQLAGTDVIDPDNVVFRSFRDAYLALYEASAGTKGP